MNLTDMLDTIQYTADCLATLARPELCATCGTTNGRSFVTYQAAKNIAIDITYDRSRLIH
jgi:hypothetical protein